MSEEIYDKTIERIASLELDSHVSKDDATVRFLLFQRFQAMTPELPIRTQVSLFAEIWDTGRLVGYTQSQRAAHALLASGQAVSLVMPKCPGCPKCKLANEGESEPVDKRWN